MLINGRYLAGINPSKSDDTNINKGFDIAFMLIIFVIVIIILLLIVVLYMIQKNKIRQKREMELLLNLH